MLIFDIETGPLPDDQLRELFEPPEPPPHPGDFDPLSVKTGNLKDQKKIDAKIAEAKRKHDEAVAGHSERVKRELNESWTAFRDQAALDAVTGRVLAIGYADVDSGRTAIDAPDTEHTLLTTWWDEAELCRAHGRKLVGLNIFDFDLPFLIRRSWILEVDVPDWAIPKPRYFDPIFVDLRTVWLLGQHQSKCRSNFDHLAKAFNTGGKPDGVDGSQFATLWEEDRQAAIEYLKNDLMQPVEWCKRMGVV